MASKEESRQKDFTLNDSNMRQEQQMQHKFEVETHDIDERPYTSMNQLKKVKQPFVTEISHRNSDNSGTKSKKSKMYRSKSTFNMKKTYCGKP